MTKPKPPERLEKRLARVAREQGVDQERLRRWVSFLALCGAVVLANLEVADKLGVAFLHSIPMFAFPGCTGGGFHGFLSPAYGASA